MGLDFGEDDFGEDEMGALRRLSPKSRARLAAASSARLKAISKDPLRRPGVRKAADFQLSKRSHAGAGKKGRAAMGEDDFGRAMSEDDLEGLSDKKLKAVASNLFRKKALRQAARAEITRRALAKRARELVESNEKMDERDASQRAIRSASRRGQSRSQDDGDSEDFGIDYLGLDGLDVHEDNSDLDSDDDLDESINTAMEEALTEEDFDTLGADGIDDHLEFIESFGATSATVQGAVVDANRLIAFLKSSTASGKYTKNHLVAAMPYMKTRDLQRIAKNVFRKKWVRAFADAEVKRRVARKRAGQPVTLMTIPATGMIAPTAFVSMDRINTFAQKYSSPTRAMQAVVARPTPAPVQTAQVSTGVPATNADRRAAAQATQARAAKFVQVQTAVRNQAGPSIMRPPVGPSSTRPLIPATNAARRAQEAAARKATYDAAHPTRAARQAAGLPVLSKKVVAQRKARRAAGLKVMPAAQRRAIEGRRGNLRGDDMFDVLGEEMGATRAARQAAGLPVLSKAVVAQRAARRAAGLKVMPAAQRRAIEGRRGNLRGDDMLDVLGEELAVPTLSQGLMSHPFKAILIGTAIFGVGALVGKDRILDAGLAIGDMVAGTTHGVIKDARTRRLARG